VALQRGATGSDEQPYAVILPSAWHFIVERLLKTYIHAAAEVEKAGLKVALKKTSGFEMPDEFALKLKAMPALKKAFNALTPGRQRGYLLHFSSAKQSKTRAARIGRNVDRIMAGKGLED
jgi:uncharacterized protein YdeI (YjbR/CyaY-like superfamily)